MGLALLAADARSDAQSKTPTDTLSDVWAVPFPPMDVEGGNVSLSIVDEARKLPINLMVNQGGAPNQAAIAKMQRLFTILDVNTDLIQGIIQWISPNGANGAGGDSFYAGLIPPYAPRNGPMPTIADLQMVEGFNQAIFNRVSPFLTVMPETAVNANTASPQVLAALEPQWTEDQKVVQQIVEARTIRPFTQPTDIMNLLGTSAPPTLAHDVTMRSQFFTVVGTGTYAGARKIITATFQRQTSGVGMLAAWHED
jgi:general secretion pathway protein K